MLRLIRRDPNRARWDGRFFENSPHFAPIARAANVFADHADWPDVDEYNRLFGSKAATHRFVLQAPVPTRTHKSKTPVPPRTPADLYDAFIVRGEIPTRHASWHDYLNALVWATFPRAKAALHARQHAVIERWIRDRGALAGDGTIIRLPGARTREHDALALIDEGGVVVFRAAEQTRSIVFGHAIFEGLVMGTRSMAARAILHDTESLDVESCVAEADRLLTERLLLPLDPADLPRWSLD